MTIFKKITGQGEDVVLIHGWGCSHLDMEPIVNQLASRYRVTSIDLPGVGASKWSPEIDAIDDIVEAVLSALPKQAIYIGWSFGGLVAMAIAAKYPERVKHLIGIGTSPKLIESAGWVGFPAPGFSVGFDVVKQRGLKSLLKEDFADEFAAFNSKPARYERLLAILEASPEIPQDVLFKGIELCDTTDLREAYSKIQCPIDLIMGDQDFKVLITAVPGIKALNSETQVHTIKGAKHIPFWTHPDEFNKILHGII